MAKLSVDKALLKAKSHAKKGEIEQAQKLYQAVLQAFPRNKRAQQGLDALNTLTQFAAKQSPPQNTINRLINLYNRGQLQAVVEQAKALTEQYPDDFIIWNILGVANKGLNKVADAAKAFKKVTKLNPTYADGFNNLGVTLKEQGKIGEAIEAYKKALLLAPDYAEAYKNMGSALHEHNKLEEAIEAFSKAIEFKPDYPKAYNDMGMALQQYGDSKNAIQAYKKALSLKPDYYEVINNIGAALLDQEKLSDAIESFKNALLIKPDYAEAYNNLGVALKHHGKLEEAIENFNYALSLKPNYVNAYNNMGIALERQGSLTKAITAYRKALSLKPDDPEAHNNMGLSLQEQGKFAEAIQAFNRAISISPDYAGAYENMGYLFLSNLDFRQGFELYEWRWKTKENKDNFLKTKKPLWKGEENKSIFLWGEQGIGDVIMFASIIPELYAISSNVIIQCDERLIPLLKRSFSSDIKYYGNEETIEEYNYDFHIPIGSLPLYFRKDLRSFKSTNGAYLTADEALTNRLKKRFVEKSERPICGITWTGGSKRNYFLKDKNISIAELGVFLSDLDYKYINLQYNPKDEELDVLRNDFGIEIDTVSEIDNLYNLDGLAALIRACDLVISIDNLTVHLSGALGIKTYVLLPLSADWRWGVKSKTSYWHSALRLFRRQNANNWEEPLNTLLTYLK